METSKSYIAELKQAIDKVNLAELDKIIEIIKKTYDENKSIFIIGNGGSASTASHFACDLSKGALGNLYLSDKKRFKVYSLTDNCAYITAIGNDVSYDNVFLEQLKNLASPSDLLISFTASGNSANILKAIDFASSIGMIQIGFLGFGGGKAAEKLTSKIIVQSHDYGVVEDLHLILEHIITQNLKEMMER